VATRRSVAVRTCHWSPPHLLLRLPPSGGWCCFSLMTVAPPLGRPLLPADNASKLMVPPPTSSPWLSRLPPSCRRSGLLDVLDLTTSFSPLSARAHGITSSLDHVAASASPIAVAAPRCSCPLLRLLDQPLVLPIPTFGSGLWAAALTAADVWSRGLQAPYIALGSSTRVCCRRHRLLHPSWPHSCLPSRPSSVATMVSCHKRTWPGSSPVR
jgi:hypothetical protein